MKCESRHRHRQRRSCTRASTLQRQRRCPSILVLVPPSLLSVGRRHLLAQSGCLPMKSAHKTLRHSLTRGRCLLRASGVCSPPLTLVTLGREPPLPMHVVESHLCRRGSNHTSRPAGTCATSTMIKHKRTEEYPPTLCNLRAAINWPRLTHQGALSLGLASRPLMDTGGGALSLQLQRDALSAFARPKSMGMTSGAVRSCQYRITKIHLAWRRSRGCSTCPLRRQACRFP